MKKSGCIPWMLEPNTYTGLVAAAMVTVAGSAYGQITISNASGTSGYVENGLVAFRSTDVIKTHDGDGNGEYGTEGSLFIGTNGTAGNGKPLAGNTTQTGVSWATFAEGANFASISEQADYGPYDDPTLSGATVDDWAICAIAVATGGGVGNWAEVLSFSIDATTPQEFRVGIMSGTQSATNGRWDPTGLRMSVDGGTATEILSLPNTSGNTSGWVFFDVNLNGATSGTFSIEGQNRLAGQGTSISGVTFDLNTVVPDSDNDNLLDWWELAKTPAPGNLTDLTGLKDGSVNPGTPDSGDFDADGLTDLEEFDIAVTNATYPTLDPTLADSDDDGRDDFDEVNGTTGPPVIGATDPTDPDSDGDGLWDGAETNDGTFVSYDFGDNTGDTGTDPTTAQSDADGLEDGFEVTNNDAGYDPNVDDSATDFDGDASTVAEENAAGTNVLLPDTDDDGFYDGAETNTGEFVSYDYETNIGDTGTDPLNEDTDFDGLLDGVESNRGSFADANDTGTDPNRSDSDGDRYTDGLEVDNATDPTDSAKFPPFAPGYAETGGDWLTMGDNDIDGDGGLGTDGFFFFGNFDGVQENSQPFTHNVQSVPSYVAGFVEGPGFTAAAAEFPTYGAIDDPILLDGTDGLGGIGLGPGSGEGSSVGVVSFTVSGLVSGQTVRVGVLGGVEGSDNGRWDPTSITLSDGVSSATIGDHELNPLPANPGGTNSGWAFFDIQAAGDYTVSGTQRLATQGVSIGGLTFDSISVPLQLVIANNPNGTDLDFSWKSQSGKLYDLLRSTDLSTPTSTWEVWQENIPADASGTNVATYERPDDSESFFVLVDKDAPPVFAENFDGVTAPTLPEGWLVGGTAGDPATAWELGTPDSSGFETDVRFGPSAAFSGENCVGTNLTALYGPNAAVTLTSPAIDVPATVATLRFQQVVEIDGASLGGTDLGTLRLLNAADDSELKVLMPLVEGSTSGGWTSYSVAMPDEALGKSVKLEFKLSSGSNGGSADGFELAGWYIDDVELFNK